MGSAQLSLDDYMQRLPRHRTGDQSTSIQASRAVVFRASADRLLVLRTLSDHADGLTDFELAEMTGRQQTSLGKRRGECVAAGLVESVMVGDVTLRRPAPSGAAAIVWRITQAGLDYLNTL